MDINDIENKKYFLEKFVKQSYNPPPMEDIIDHDDITDDVVSETSGEQTHTIHGKQFTFEGDDYLRKDFSHELNFQSNRFDIYIVGFRINDGLEVPFMEYCLQKSENGRQYEFPFFSINKTEFSGLDNDGEEHPTNTHFKAKVSEFMKNSMRQKINMDENYKQYKGFIESNDAYYVFVEIDNNVHEDVSNDDNNASKWAMYDEIYNIKQIDELPIDEMVITLFENKHLHQFRNANNKIVPTPVFGYIVKQDDNGDLQNVSLDEDFYENTYHFDDFEDVYVFTKEPIIKTGGPYKKYAIMLRESLFVNKDEDKQKSVFKEYKSVYYVQSDVVYYLMYYYDHFHEL